MNKVPIEIFPSEYTAHNFRMPNGGKLEPFSFVGREYLIPIYDTPARRTIFKFGRQSEKCVVLTSDLRTGTGAHIRACDVRVGTTLAGMSADGVRTSAGVVTWLSETVRKPCVRITTRTGNVLEAAVSHPIRTWESWTLAGELALGARVATVRRLGTFQQEITYSDERVRLTAVLIADGYLTKQGVRVCKNAGDVLDEYIADATACGERLHIAKYPGRATTNVSAPAHGVLASWLAEDGLLGMRSADKCIPAWIYTLPKRQAALFLNRLLACDGHARLEKSSRYEIGYSSMSRRLVQDVQALLWKFGIPSGIETVWPSIYKKRGEQRHGYKLCIETQEGVRLFLTEIGILGKTEAMPLPSCNENNNRDTYPYAEVSAAIQEIHDEYAGKRPPKLYLSGLRKHPSNAPTSRKLAEYVNFFASDPLYPQEKVARLREHLGTDLLWDVVTAVEEIGEQDCVDFEVEGTHSFIAGGLITHNSTTLGNKIITNMSMCPFLRTLYIAPQQKQVEEFSKTRISKPIRMSEGLKANMRGKHVVDNVTEKEFANGSTISFRAVYFDADGTRGLAMDAVVADEIQDIYYDHFPVVEESVSHSKLKSLSYAGTPKTFDNSMEKYWGISTQCEWVIPCNRCGGGDYRFWNVVGYESVQPHGLSCTRCGKLIDARDPSAQWASMRSDEWLRNPPIEEIFEGYRIAQPMVAWLKWSEIMTKKLTYSIALFHNEVLGLSYDSGTKLINPQALQTSSNPSLTFSMSKNYVGRTALYMGIDWGGGGTDSNSYTAITIGGYDGDKFTYIYMRKLEGMDAEPKNVERIVDQLVHEYRIHMIGTDYGGGHQYNDHLIRTYGLQKILRYQYVNTKLMFFDPTLMRFMVNRTEVMMAALVNAINRTTVFMFPRWEEWGERYGGDFTCLRAEKNERTGNSFITKVPGTSDDVAHSAMYCFLASMVDRPRPDILTPDKEGTISKG